MNTITHEIINYQSNIPIKLFFQRIGTVGRHWHNSIEILFVLQGHMTVTVEENCFELGEDDIFLINPHHIHETCSKDCSLIVVQIRLSEFHLDWAIPEDIQFDCCSAGEPGNPRRYFYLKHLIAMLLKNNSSGRPFSSLSNYTCAVRLIEELCTNFRSTDPVQEPHSVKYLNRIRSIQNYIHENYMKNITLTEIARREFLTPTYLSAFFERTMGVPLSVYIANVRLDHAVNDLISTSDSIEMIASRNGFSSPRAFSAAFKKSYRLLPSEYRRQLKASEMPDASRPENVTERMTSGAVQARSGLLVPKHQNSYLKLERYDFLDKLASYLRSDPLILEQGDSATLQKTFGTVDVKLPACKTWGNTFKCFCGVSRASELLLAPVQSMIRRAQQEIGFEYIKFHGILDDELMVCTRDGAGELCFNFAWVDMILDFLLENHLRPLIQFSFMPAALAADPARVIFEKPVIVSPPSRYEEWEALITALTGHLLERYGNREVRSWIFTFWNETLNGLSFDFDRAQTALELYRRTRQCVKNCDPCLTFASTSYSALEFPEFNYDRFLEFAREKDCLPDVYIFHFYPVVADNNAFNPSARQWKANDYTRPVALSRDPDVFGKFLDGLTASGIPAQNVYITEWNFTPSHREWLNDTCFCACYIVRNLIHNFDKAAGFCHWCLTDLHQELPAPKLLFHGGMGLFTREQIPKPSYYAYTFLNALYPEVLMEQEGVIITRGENGLAMLLYNYCHFDNLYGHGISFGVTAKNWQKAFPDARPLEISFELSGLSRGTYTLTWKYVSPDNGSAFEAWMDMGSPQPDTPEVVQMLKNRACPGFYRETVEISGESYHFRARLMPHEIRLVTLERWCFRCGPV